MRFVVTVDGLEEPVLCEVLSDNGVNAVVRVGERDITLRSEALGNSRWLVGDERGQSLVDVLGSGGDYEVLLGSHQVGATAIDERDTWLGDGGGGQNQSTVSVAMPGKVVHIDTSVGAAVVAGQRLLVIEAMKMENDVKSPRDGVVAAIHVAPGDAVEAGQALVELE